MFADKPHTRMNLTRVASAATAAASGVTLPGPDAEDDVDDS